MTAAIPAVTNTFTANTIPLVARNFQLPEVVSDSISTPSAVVTLGMATTSSVTSNAQTLFNALLQAAFGSQSAAGSATATQTAGNAAPTSVADLATLLGFDTSASSSNLLDAAAGSQNIAAVVSQAVTSSLPSGITATATNATDTSSITSSLIQVLADSLNSAASGLDNSTAASLLSASGIVQGQATSDIQQAVNGLLTSNPGLAATILNANSTSSSLLDLASAQTATVATSADQSQLTPLTPILSLATASLSASSIITTATTSSATVNAITPETVVAATGATATNASTTDTISATATVNDVTAAEAAVAETTATSANNASDTTAATSAVANNFLQDYAAQALANIAGNPAYADIAGVLYMSAMILHSQLASADNLPDSSRITQPVYAVHAINSV